MARQESGFFDEEFPNLAVLRYIREMLSKYTEPRMRSPWKLLLGLLCIALILVCGTISVTHTHADGRAHADCSLCITAHTVVQASAPPAPVFAPHVFIEIEAVYLPTQPQILSYFSLFSRPPPADSPRS
jgi:hypothetical protein